MVNLFQYFKGHPKYNKIVGDDFLAVEYKCPINAEEFQLWTETNLITYIISGRKDWIAPDKTYKIEGGDALFVKKGVYTTKQYFEVDYCVILFFLSDDFIRNFIIEQEHLKTNHNYNLDNDSVYKIDVNDSLQSLIFTVFNYLQQNHEVPKDLISIKFKELLYNIILNSKNHKILNYFKSLKLEGKLNLENVMNKHFQYDLKLEDFAKLCGTSLSSFKRSFKQNFNDTPANWLKQKRLQYAGSLLKNTSLNISEICYESGFKNPSHFNKAFKAIYKITPNQYRLNSTEN